MLIRCEMLKKLANAFIEVAKEENLPVNITMGRSYTDSGLSLIHISEPTRPY